MKQVNTPDDCESPNDRFFTHPVVDWFLTNAGTTITFDWKTLSLGDTIKEKNEALYTKLVETTNMVVQKGGKGFFWIVCTPQMSDFMATSVNFVPAFNEQFPLGYNIVQRMGILGKRWLIYSDPLVAADTLLIGAGFSKKHVNYYCKIKIENM